MAVMALCEAAAYWKSQGMTLCDKMQELFETYGYYQENLCTVTLKGQNGARQIAEMMENIRAHVPKSVGGLKVVQFRDYREDVKLDMVRGEKTGTGLPKSNVLYFELEKGAWCCVRPSGTEPKIKFYIGVKGESKEEAEDRLQNLTEAVKRLV